VGRRDNDMLASEDAIGYGLRSLISQQAPLGRCGPKNNGPRARVENGLSGAAVTHCPAVCTR
jgi:hypothetical protein